MAVVQFADPVTVPDKTRFYGRLEEFIGDLKTTTDNTNYFSDETYSKFLKETKEALEKLKSPTFKYLTEKDKRRLRRFNICTISGEDRLIEGNGVGNPPPTTMKFFVKVGDLYDVILEAHLATEHKGRNVLQDALGKKYANVTKVAIQKFLDLCPTCLKKKRTKRRGLVVRPMVFNQLNDRMQIDLVDMQTMADGEWKWILVCQDHLTKFIHLRPLKSKRAIEVAEHVLSIFLVFGAPTVLQSDNGREFCNAIIDSLRETWPELKIVHGE